MHSHNIVHRDLKHLNIFLSDYGPTPKVRIGDFGMAAYLKNDQCIKKVAGTIGFMAPEVVLNQHSDFKADIWSLGIILYALICSKVPFYGATKTETGEKIVNQPLSFDLPVWDSVSDECKSLIKRMLDKDQNTRMTINEVLAHLWVNKGSIDRSKVAQDNSKYLINAPTQ